MCNGEPGNIVTSAGRAERCDIESTTTCNTVLSGACGCRRPYGANTNGMIEKDTYLAFLSVLLLLPGRKAHPVVVATVCSSACSKVHRFWRWRWWRDFRLCAFLAFLLLPNCSERSPIVHVVQSTCSRSSFFFSFLLFIFFFLLLLLLVEILWRHVSI